MKRIAEYDDFVKDHGLALYGVADLCLALNDALAAVVLARKAGVAILGGDVYVRRSGKIVPAYANWHTERQQGESQDAYARRTWQESETYLRGYPTTEDSDPLFSLVVDD